MVITFMVFRFLKLGGRFPRFVSREMEAMYIEELRSSVNLLMANLESMPVSKGAEFKLQKLKRGHNTSIMDMGQEDENLLSKSDVVLSFTLEVSINSTNNFYLKCIIVSRLLLCWIKWSQKASNVKNQLSQIIHLRNIFNIFINLSKLKKK